MLPTVDALADALKYLMESPSPLMSNGFSMLKANYYAPNRTISATRLAMAAGYTNYRTGNQQYGAFAHRLADLLDFEPDNPSGDETRWTYLLCEANSLKSQDGHFQWIMRHEVAEAMEMVGLASRTEFPDPFEDVANTPVDMDSLSEKSRDMYIKARIGQGAYRDRLIGYWGGCSVTRLDAHEMLIASHIMPWRDCDFSQAIDLMNGLLLTPNLDKAFDRGFISFEYDGVIMISPQIVSIASGFGIHSGMKICEEKLLDMHQDYLSHHRASVFRAKT